MSEKKKAAGAPAGEGKGRKTKRCAEQALRIWGEKISPFFFQAKKAGSPAFLPDSGLEASVTAAVAVVAAAAAQKQQDDPDVLTSATAAVVAAEEAAAVAAAAAQKQQDPDDAGASV